ncbi:GNAT family N-acetyltransferase [Pseudonocardia sp. CA-107938]|uniref:GNAT family N-acetyltransferase n=1 Tax=Pseudonocardia sp. CA-107938 TaxID=3240021 RepID=UPI003D8AA203
MIPVLETERLVLRPLAAADADALYAFRSDPVEQRWNDPPLTEPAQAAELIERLAAEHRTIGARHWGLTLRGDDTVRGLLGYNEVVAAHARAAIGYDLARQLWGRGLMSEAMRAVLDHGFADLRLNRVEAHTNDVNAASIRMLRRLGFWREGTFHERFHEDGEYHDVALFVMLARDRRPHTAPSRTTLS